MVANTDGVVLSFDSRLETREREREREEIGRWEGRRRGWF